ncbi:antitoxin PaaA2 family protein [Pseudomonas urmiensis]|uniref:antitoxin PaaA2 family protein n=1 Tax=Pseudomonas urmiensis TaxID=2745493 RepID=UPI0034D79B0C
MKPRHTPVPTHQLDHAELRRMAETGRINGTHIVGQPGGWAIQVNINHDEHVLTAQRSGNTRLFKKLETLVSYLHELGIDHFQVDSSTYDPLQMSTYQRPDRASALKRAHQAAAYDAWFIEQVEASLNDPTPAMDDEQIEKEFAARRLALKGKTR